MKIFHIVHVWISNKKKKFQKIILWIKVFIFYIFNIKKIKKSDSYFEFKYLLTNGISCFPYSFVHQYKEMKFHILYDGIYPYVFENGLKIYFNYNWSPEKVVKYYREVSLEQNINSPHCYYNKSINYSDYDIAIDIGAAEGNFSISLVSDFKEIYLYERDEIWINCLERTFQNYLHKVEIINKYVGNLDNHECIRLDSNTKLYNKNLLVKIDVEGHELQVLEGMISLLSQNKLITIIVCTYHQQNDQFILNEFLSKLGYSNTYSNGYMFYFYDKKIKKPFLRKALMFSTNGEN